MLIERRNGSRKRAIVIAGPTASGKSALALALAARLGGTVINADSMQVYRDLRVLTARPAPEDEARVPHRLYGTVDGAQAFSVSLWLAATTAAIAEVEGEARLPIVVGGTGLYLKALTQGLSAIPPVPATIRDAVRALAATQPPEALHAMLARRDPATASRLRPSDPQRIARALEVHMATGESLATFQDSREAAILPIEDCAAVVLTPDRAVLRQRVDRRFDDMMAAGALAEVEALAGRRLDPALPVMRALGVPPLLAALRGALDMKAAVERGKLDSRQYLKRQETFARHQLVGFGRLPPDQAEDALLAQFS